MRNAEWLYRPEDVTCSPFVRAVADERGLEPKDAVFRINAWVVRVRERVEGSGCSGPVLRELFDGLRRYGFLPSVIQSMVNRFPNLLCCGWHHAHGTEEVPGLLLLLERYGFNRQQLLRMCYHLPALLSFSWRRTYGSQAEPGLLLLLERHGFDRDQLIGMCARFPSLLSYSWRRTHGTDAQPGTLLRLEGYGFCRDQVTVICARFPTVLGYAWQRTQGTLSHLETAGFTRAQVIGLCAGCPILLGCRWERTAAQLRMAAVFGLPLRSQLFLFAPAKTRWRWEFLTWTRKLPPERTRAALFLSRAEFYRRFQNDYETDSR